MRDSVRLALCRGAALILVVGACTSSGSSSEGEGGSGGQGSGGRNGGSAGGSSGGSSGGTAKACGVPSRMRRLTVEQYKNVIAQTFGNVAGPSDSFPGPSGVGRPNTGFSNDPDYTVITTKGVQDLLDAAEEVATKVASQSNNLQGCNKDEACATKFLDKYGSKLLRRPLTDDEKATFLGVYKAGATGANAFQDGVGAMLVATLMSPGFIFQVEQGTPTDKDGIVELTPFEKATRLSMTLWDSGPDDTLLDAAKNGKLSSVDDIRSQAERMLSDDRAKPTIARFGREWLWHEPTLAKGGSKTKHTEYTDAMNASMTAEFDAFINGQFLSKDGSIKALFTSNKTSVDKTMAGYYGVDASGISDGQLKQVSIDDGKRAGVLTLPAVLTSLAHQEDPSYVFRGANVVKNVLCMSLGDPPADAQQQGATLTMSAANPRDKSAIIVKQAKCAGCHKIIDSIGLAYEGYDEIGKRRDKLPDGSSIDESGEVLGVDGVGGKFSSPVDLAGRLGDSKQVERCMATQLYKYAYARVPSDDNQEEVCALDALADPNSKDLTSPRDLLLRLVTSPDFGTRRIGGR